MGNQNSYQLTVQTAISEPQRPKLESALALGAATDHNPPQIQLRLGDVQASGPPGVIYRVYLNEPTASATTEPAAANFVGELALFVSAGAGAHPHAEHAHGREYRFDITPLVRRLRSTKKWDAEKLSVTFVPKGVGQNRPKAEVTVGRIHIVAVQD
jgi:hypothetical protein